MNKLYFDPMEWRSTLDNFEEHLVQSRLERGYDYFTEEKVLSLEQLDGGIWQAKVEGNAGYDVKVELTGRIIGRTSCNCPNKVEFCKHVIAVVYELRSRKL